MAKKKVGKWLVQIRAHPDGQFCSVWLVRRDGPADSPMLFGDVVPAIAEEIAAVLALPTERENSLFTGVEPIALGGCATVAQQRDLFASQDPLVAPDLAPTDPPAED